MTSLFVSEQRPQDDAEIDQLLDLTFGIARRTKTSYRLREGNVAAKALSLTVREEGFGIAGSISFWPLLIGEAQTPAILLGPLAVHPEKQSRGIGKILLQESLSRAQEMRHKLVLLIGDAPYYLRAGFTYVPTGQIDMPGPVDPTRLLYLELVAGAMSAAYGLALPPFRWRDINALRAATSH